jgi:SAM-dependent methyltransferase
MTPSTTEVPADDLALIARHLSVRPGTVLDVGCGPGHLTAHLRSLGDATAAGGSTGRGSSGAAAFPGRSMSTYRTRVRSVVDVS